MSDSLVTNLANIAKSISKKRVQHYWQRRHYPKIYLRLKIVLKTYIAKIDLSEHIITDFDVERTALGRQTGLVSTATCFIRGLHCIVPCGGTRNDV